MTGARSASPGPKDLVRRGYDAASYRYREDADSDAGDRREWIRRLIADLPAGADVLDLGCGCGIPASRDLAAAGMKVTGVDFSDVQIGRARDFVPEASFIRSDATEVSFAPASFDAVVCLYMLIHLPLDEQPPLLAKIASWLRPGGRLLATAGHRAWTGTEENWLGGDAPMWWSHADEETYAAWLSRAGFVIDTSQFVPEGSGGHTLFWCRVS